MMNHRLRYLSLLAIVSIASTLHAQQPCSEEVKLLLNPAQLQTVIPALQATGKTQGHIYFYDTPNLDLLSKGVILRLRVRAEIDLTAKLRPPSGEKFTDPSNGRYTCEVDLNNGIENQSFLVQNKYLSAKAPPTGEELFHLLSDTQKQLLADSGVQIDWKQVKRIADIQSTSWIGAKATTRQVESRTMGVARRKNSRAIDQDDDGHREGHLRRAAEFRAEK